MQSWLIPSNWNPKSFPLSRGLTLHTIGYCPLTHSASSHCLSWLSPSVVTKALLSQGICTCCFLSLTQHPSQAFTWLAHSLHLDVSSNEVFLDHPLWSSTSVPSLPLSCFIFLATLLITWCPLFFESFMKCQLRKWKQCRKIADLLWHY